MVCTVRSAGRLYLCLLEGSTPAALRLAGAWEPAGTMRADYGSGSVPCAVHRRDVEAGEKLVIPSPNKWGSVLAARQITGLPAHQSVFRPASSGGGGLRAPQAPAPAEWTLEYEFRQRWAELGRRIAGRQAIEARASQTLRADALIRASDGDPVDVVLRRTDALLRDLRRLGPTRDLAQDEARLRDLQAEAKRTPPATPARPAPAPRARPGRARAAPAGGLAEQILADLAAPAPAAAPDKSADRCGLFVRACRLRRRIAFANPLLDFDEILFVKRHRSRFSHMCDQFHGCFAVPGGGLFILSDPFTDEPKVRNVLADAHVSNGRLMGRKLLPGAFLSPELSFDGRTILFAYTEALGGRGFDWGRANTSGGWDVTSAYHLFRVNVDGSNLRQLTDGRWNDFDPAFLPNGRVAFVSERRGGQLRCGARPNPTYAMHTMLPDGTDIRRLSHHETHEWQPSVNNDGLVVYTRWDYVDRDSDIAHHPWVTTPDGRDARAIHGNYPGRSGREKRPWMEMDVRAVPGSRKYVATAAPHHGQAYGSLVLLDPDIEDDDVMSQLKRITPDVPFPESEGPRGAQLYGTAWPLSEDYYLGVYCYPDRLGGYGIYLLDSFGNKVALYRDAAVGCRDPIPLRPRAVPPLMPKLTAAGERQGGPAGAPPSLPDGTIACLNVYDGLKPWPEGTAIRALRIIQLFPKTNQPAEMPRVSGSAIQSLCRGVLGTVPVEADGSAYFRAPAGKLVYFQAVDANGCAAQSMRSATYLQGGERLICQGCHERRYRAPSPPKNVPLALRRAPSNIQPEVDGSFPVFYPRLVQPVLDRRCVPCHARQKKAPDLAGTPARPFWTKSYAALSKHAFGFSGGNGTCRREGSRTTPGRFGAYGAKLYKMLAAGHHDLKLPPAELRRIALWLDCNSNFYGAYHEIDAQNHGRCVMPTLE